MLGTSLTHNFGSALYTIERTGNKLHEMQCEKREEAGRRNACHQRVQFLIEFCGASAPIVVVIIVRVVEEEVCRWASVAASRGKKKKVVGCVGGRTTSF